MLHNFQFWFECVAIKDQENMTMDCRGCTPTYLRSMNLSIPVTKLKEILISMTYISF